MSSLSRLIARRTQATVEGPAVDELQDPLMEIDDQLYYVTHEHVPNTFRGQAFTTAFVGMPPPIEYEEPDTLPGAGPGVELVYYHPHTRPGVGIDDLDPLIPEGEDGW